jgi:hypothetical protein
VVSLSTALALKMAGPTASRAIMTAVAATAMRDSGVRRSTTAAPVLMFASPALKAVQTR